MLWFGRQCGFLPLTLLRSCISRGLGQTAAPASQKQPRNSNRWLCHRGGRCTCIRTSRGNRPVGCVTRWRPLHPASEPATESNRWLCHRWRPLHLAFRTQPRKSTQLAVSPLAAAAPASETQPRESNRGCSPLDRAAAAMPFSVNAFAWRIASP